MLESDRSEGVDLFSRSAALAVAPAATQLPGLY